MKPVILTAVEAMLSKVQPRKSSTEVSSHDLSFIQKIIALVQQHDKTRWIESNFRVISIDEYIVQTSITDGRHGWLNRQQHDLRTYEGQVSFGEACEKMLANSLYFLAVTDPTDRPYSASRKNGEFVQSDLEPALTLFCILRKMHGYPE